jgi:hypothetical protein
MANQIAWGFHNLQHIFDQRVTDQNVPVLNTAIDETLAEHRRQVDALFGIFVRNTTEFKVRYQSAALANLQPLDQNGRALPVLIAGYYEVALPIQRAGTAWGANYITRVKMTVQEVNNITNTLIMADLRWMRYHVLAALYANAAWTFNDPQYGNLTIQGLANGDATTYQIMAGSDMGATDTHYLAQAAVIADGTDPFPAIFTELTEHPENSGDVIAFIPSNLKAAVQALTSYYPAADPNIDPGASSARLTGTLGIATPGTLFGYHDAGVWLVEWPNLPNDYIIATMTGGERPIAMREEPEAELRGFNRVAERENYPFYESQYLRMAGFGGWNRVGALVYRVGNATYSAAPTGYVSPIP